MGESKAHKSTKSKVAGKTGKTEVTVGKSRIDVITKTKAVEIERCGNYKDAIKRLEKAPRSKRELRVPHTEMDKAKEVAKKVAKKPLVISNLGGTKKI